jgi:hypothetical protein
MRRLIAGVVLRWNDDPGSGRPRSIDFHCPSGTTRPQARPAKVPIDVVVINHIEHPSENCLASSLRLLSRRAKDDRDVGLNGHRLAVECVGFVLPRFHRVNR